MEHALVRRFLGLAALLAMLAACRANPGSGVTPTVSNAAASASCAALRFAKPFAPAYANTLWPSERHDQWRTAAAAAGLPAKFRGALRTARAKLPPVPVWGYVGLDGYIYVLGGSPYVLDVFTKLVLGAPTSSLPLLLAESLHYSKTLTPYVARIDPSTMSVTTLQLTKGIGINYVGGMLVDSDGYLYAVARGVLYKIDPKSFTIVLSKRLPFAPDAAGRPDKRTAYNGMQATVDGDLILKGFVPLGGDPGILLRINPADFSIEAELESTQIAGARMALARNGGREYAYLVGATDSTRFLLGARSFTLDTTYSRQYLFPSTGDTEGTSALYMGHGVIFTNNTSPAATSPMSIFAQSASAGSTLESEAAFDGSGAGWNFFMASGDPYQTGLLAVQNQENGHVAGFLACGGGAATQKLWENDTIHDSAGMAIDDATGQLYADDHRCTSKGKCTLSLVVLDLRTGKEIARTRVAGDEPSMGQIFIGPHDRVFYLASDTDEPNGFITRITAH
jgi:hypothetical protein